MEALGLNLPGLIAQVINFSLLLFLLTRLLYKPILRVLDERSRRIQESLERAESIKKEAERAEREVQNKLEAARKEGQVIVAQAAQIGERLKDEARQEARREGEALITRARSEIERERDEAIAELRKEFVELTIAAAGKVINRSLDRTAHEQLIKEVLEESTILKGN